MWCLQCDRIRGYIPNLIEYLKGGLMDTKINRVGSYVALEIINLVVIWLLAPLASLTPVVFWVLIVASLLVDQFVLAWSMGVLKETEVFHESTVVGIWTAEQVAGIAILTVWAILHLGFLIGLSMLVILGAWAYWRTGFLGKLLDIRYW